VHLNFETATFRTNPAHELILFEHLSESERRELGQLTSDPDYCAIVRSRPGTAWRVKMVCRNTVDLCSNFGTPGSLSPGLSAKFGDSLHQAVTQLVLDGVLEVEYAGGFVSGPAAYALFREERRQTAPDSRIARLSMEALRHAETLAIDDSMRLCARLYFYNRQPLSPEQRIRFPDDRAVHGFLGVAHEGNVQKVLATSWQASRLPALERRMADLAPSLRPYQPGGSDLQAVHQPDAGAVE
jgi:hypothetical protein